MCKMAAMAKRLMALAFLSVFACSVAQAKKVQKAPKTPAPAAAAAPAPANAPSALEVSTPPANAQELIARFEDIDRQIQSLRARYRQQVRLEEADTVQTIEGRIEYLKPDRLRIEHTKPERQTVVSDGRSIWVYRQSANQVIQSELADWRKADPVMSSLLDFGGYSALAKRYDVAYSSAAREATLTPKDKAAQFTLRLKLADKTYFPVETELALAHMKVKTSLEGVELNPKVTESDFVFTPPSGADIFLNFKPPKVGP